MLDHVPIALFFTSVLVDAVGAWLKRGYFRDGAFQLRISGLLRVAAAMPGDWAEETAEKAGMAKSMIETHETPAFATLGSLQVPL